MEEHAVQQNMKLLDLWAVVVKRRLLGGGIFFAILMVTLILSISQTPVYRGTVTILVESETPQVVKVDDVTTSDPRGQDYYQTQYKVLESHTLARDVIRRLALDTNPEFTGENSWIKDIVYWIRDIFSSSKDQEELADPLNPYVKTYIDNLSIVPVPKSRLIGINFDGHDRVLVANIANEHANAYINLTLSFRLTGSKDAATWLMGQTEGLKETLKLSERKLQGFTRENDMLALESMISVAAVDRTGQYNERGGSSEANFVSQRLTELNTQQSVLKSERIAAETLYKQIKELSVTPEMIESIPEISNNLLIQRLKGDYVGLSRQLSDMKETFGDKHPKMIAIKEEMNGLLSKIKIEVAKIARGVQLQYEMSLAKERNIAKELEELKKNASILNEKLVKYMELKSDVELNRDLYNKVLKRAKETTLTSGLSATNVVVVDPAETPIKPIKPKILLNMGLASVLGFIISIGVIFFVENIDGAVNNPEEAEKIFNMPCLGAIEIYGNKKSENGLSISTLLSNENSGVRNLDSMNSLVTNTLFSISDKRPFVLMVTSTVPEEGKSSVSALLSIAFSQSGRNALLIDCDLRKPTLHKLFNVALSPGLTDYMEGNSDLCILKAKENLDLFTAGTILHNTLPLVSSAKIEALLKHDMLKKYHCIFIDTPPILATPDAQHISKSSDGILYIVKASQTNRKIVNKAISYLKLAKGNVIGTVLNQVDMNKDKSYYGKYNKYYGYYENNKQGL